MLFNNTFHKDCPIKSFRAVFYNLSNNNSLIENFSKYAFIGNVTDDPLNPLDPG